MIYSVGNRLGNKLTGIEKRWLIDTTYLKITR